MPFEKKDEKKGISLPGLIDIIFLLLIFALVTLSVSQAQVETKQRGNQGKKYDLPEVHSNVTEEIDKVFKNLLFQIEYSDSDDPQSPKILYVLHPNLNDSLTLEEARALALKDSLFAEFPVNCATLSERAFNRLPAAQLISESIRQYKERYFFEPHPFHAVEIRAVKQTEFRIINHIMNQCSMYQDTIPRLVVHTISGREVGHGL